MEARDRVDMTESKSVRILAIETSCDETAAAVITDDGTILAGHGLRFVRLDREGRQLDVTQARAMNGDRGGTALS